MIEAVTSEPFVARVTAFPPGLDTVAHTIADAAAATVTARTTTGVTEDPDTPGDYLATITLAAAGAYTITWDFGGDVTATETINVVGFDYSPSVDDVAAVLRDRTYDSNGSQIGTFNETTRPTGDQVDRLIGLASQQVYLRIGGAPPAALVEPARHVIALKAAMLIELSYYGDQVAAAQSQYPQLKDMYDEDLAALTQGRADLGADDVPGTADDQAPVWSFPILTDGLPGSYCWPIPIQERIW